MTAGSKNTENVHVLRSGKVVGKAEVQKKSIQSCQAQANL